MLDNTLYEKASKTFNAYTFLMISKLGKDKELY